MNAVIAPEVNAGLKDKTEIRATDFDNILEHYKDSIEVLSLDCFDTLLWRKTAAPKDVFYLMQQRPLFQSLGITAYQRINAAAQAYRLKFLRDGNREIKLRDIYEHFTSFTQAQKDALVEEEVLAEMDSCYPFPPVVDLIRKAQSYGMKIVIVSDTYLEEPQLRKLLAHCLPQDVMNSISQIFCSSEYGKSKSTGIFEDVLLSLAKPAASILHIGDHKTADFEAPKKVGIKALHFLQFEAKIADFLRMQHTSVALMALSEPSIKTLRSPRYSPFRGILSACNYNAEKPETLIGYMTFGPIFYAFANFIEKETEELKRAGKRPKVFFLMRDGYLLSKSCEAFSGKEVGKCVRIRKFVAVASSFKTREDVDFYLSSITPQYYNLHVICEQLLLPQALTNQIIQIAYSSPNPEKMFNDIIHRDEILQVIFKLSADYRERLKRYMQKEMNLEAGDTVVLVDVGYIGVTQKHLSRALSNELNVDFFGLYLIASHEPDRPPSKALMTSTSCDHGLFEQSCTYKEGSVLGYDEEGNPIFDQVKLSDEQYAKVKLVQDESLRFIKDAKAFFSKSNGVLSDQILQETALASLRRHVYLPMDAEVTYYQQFQHDKDMGPNLNKTMFNVSRSNEILKHSSIPFNIHPYEMRAANLEITLSSMIQRALSLEFNPDEMSLNQETLNVVVVQGGKTKEMTVKSVLTHDGYYAFFIPNLGQAQIGILFGKNYEWLQIETIRLVGQTNKNADAINKLFVFTQIENRKGNLFECETDNAMLVILPVQDNAVQGYQFVYRPIIKRIS